MKPHHEMMTVREAATALRVCRKTIERYIASGLLPDIKPMGRRLIPSESVVDLIANGGKA